MGPSAWCIALVLCPNLLGAIELDPMPAEQAVEVGGGLAKLVETVEKLPVKVEANVDAARGLLSSDQENGLLVIPAKTLADDRNSPVLADEKGAPVGILFFHNLLAEDIDKKDKLFKLNYSDPNGIEREIRFAILTIRKFSDEDFKLLVWWTEDKPLVQSQLEEEAGQDATPVELEVVGDELEMTWLGRYPCYLGLKKERF